MSAPVNKTTMVSATIAKNETTYPNGETYIAYNVTFIKPDGLPITVNFHATSKEPEFALDKAINEVSNNARYFLNGGR